MCLLLNILNIHLYCRFANTDYVLAHTLADTNDMRWIRLSYDIWCSYSKNLKKRFSKHFPWAAKILDNLSGAIPKLHIRNHLEACQLLWSFNYTKYSGETCGELIETGWSEGNQAAGSTKEMNDGHRHDMLDEYHGYWNWSKMHRLSLFSMYMVVWANTNCHKAFSLYRSYNNCLDVLKKREIEFQQLKNATPSDHLLKWSAMDDTPCRNGKQVISVHVPQVKKGMYFSVSKH